MAKKKESPLGKTERPLGITLLIFLLVIHLWGNVRSLLNAREIDVLIWSPYYLSWLSYTFLIFFVILALYLLYACIKGKKPGLKWAKVYFIVCIIYAILSFSLMLINQKLVEEAINKAALNEANPQEAAAFAVSFVNKFTFFFLLGAIAFYSYIIHYLSKNKENFSED